MELGGGVMLLQPQDITADHVNAVAAATNINASSVDLSVTITHTPGGGNR